MVRKKKAIYFKVYRRVGPVPDLGQSPGPWAWGFLLLLISLLVNLPAFAEGNFLVKMVSPQHFRIQPQVLGPVSTSLTGGGGSQQLTTCQENGRTVIYAQVPPGAILILRAGKHCLHLWMTSPQDYYYRED
jgi:hypothetical protein